MLVEIAIGDAYGAGFEFSDRAKINAHNRGTHYIQHDLGIAAGCYTDDTQMSIALAERLLTDTSVTKANAADAFVLTFKRDPRQGYAKRFQALLESCDSGTVLLDTIHPFSTRNGAMMRAVPLGLIQDQAQLLVTAEQQASVTHQTPEGIVSAQLIALAAHELLYNQIPLTVLPALLQNKIGFAIKTDWAGEVACDAVQTIHAVFTSLLCQRTLSQLLIDCVHHGGDVDSVAAVAVGLASLSAEYTNDLPSSLYDGLEQGAYGLAFLQNLDRQLAQHFSVNLGCNVCI